MDEPLPTADDWSALRDAALRLLDVYGGRDARPFRAQIAVVAALAWRLLLALAESLAIRTRAASSAPPPRTKDRARPHPWRIGALVGSLPRETKGNPVRMTTPRHERAPRHPCAVLVGIIALCADPLGRARALARRLHRARKEKAPIRFLLSSPLPERRRRRRRVPRGARCAHPRARRASG